MVICLSGALPSYVFAQEGQKEKKPRKRQETRDVYKSWLENDVPYIITEEERKAFKALKTDDEREQFIENFWLRRDPDPDTEENEYREEYYRRIAYANEHFTSGIPGWKTDRGRIYIMFGPPDSKESHPSGGSYQRPWYEGGGTTSTFPFEIWWYRHIDGVGDGIEIEFVDPTMSGEYRIARSPEEKDALLYVPNAGLTLAEELGLSTKADRPFFQGGPFAQRDGALYGTRAQDQPFERLQRLADLQRPPKVKFGDLATKASDPIIDFDVLPLAVRTDFLKLGDKDVVTFFTLQLEHQDLAFKNLGGVHQATVNVFGKIRSIAGKSPGILADTAISTPRYTDETLPIGLKQRSAYQNNVILPPGHYKIDLYAQDVNSGKRGVVHHSFIVPRYDPEQLSTSSIFIADRIEPLDNSRVTAGMFIIGRNKVVPKISQSFKPNQPLGVFLQIYNAKIDQTTLKPDITVEYIITKDGNEIKRIKEDGKNGISELDGQQLVAGRMLPIEDLTPGNYKVVVKITDNVAQTSISPEADFKVIPQ